MGTETWIISLPLSDSILYLKIIHPPNFREEPFFYISNEGISLLENAGHLGLPIPAKMKEVLEQLHDRSEKGDE